MKTKIVILIFITSILSNGCEVVKKKVNNTSESENKLLFDTMDMNVDSTTIYIPMEFISSYNILRADIQKESKTDLIYQERIRSIRNLDTVQLKAYSNILYKYGEPTISAKKINKDDVFRLLVLDWKKPPKVIRITQRGDSIQVIKKEGIWLEPRVRSIPQLERTSIKYYEASKWNKLNQCLIQAKYFDTMESVIDDQGIDGWTWILEVQMDGKYKAVSRWVPTEEKEFISLCEYILMLAK